MEDVQWYDKSELLAVVQLFEQNPEETIQSKRPSRPLMQASMHVENRPPARFTCSCWLMMRAHDGR